MRKMMKSLVLFAAAGLAAAALAAPLASMAQPAPDGAALFESRCKFCHEGGSGPSKSVLAAHTPAQIVDILTNGVMAPMAAGMTDADKAAVAAYLTAGAATATPATPATPPTPAAPTAPAAPATPAP
jgi:mono/diheme cytochrome c family protein